MARSLELDMGDGSRINWDDFLSNEWDEDQKEIFLQLLKIYNQTLSNEDSEELEQVDSEFMIYQNDTGPFAIERLLQDIAAATDSAPEAADPANLDIYKNSDSYRYAHYEIVQSLTEAPTNRIDCVLSTTGSLYYEAIDQLLEKGASLRLIFLEEPFAIIQNDTTNQPSTSSQSYYEWLYSVINHQDAKVYVSSKEINIELFLLDDLVCVGIYTPAEDGGSSSGSRFSSLIGTDPQFYDWASRVFSYHCNQAYEISDLDEPVR